MARLGYRVDVRLILASPPSQGAIRETTSLHQHLYIVIHNCESSCRVPSCPKRLCGLITKHDDH